jgi:UDP-2,4-diacetamido-2,4,6-trideoxy-beta-L-altropyranose hydrolase
MRFTFRVDSSPIIGMGHLMRCLTLANGLKKCGFECSFICRDFVGNGARRFIGDDFPLDLMSIEGLELSEDWLGVPFEKDVKDTINIISKEPVDWLVIDHYEIDERWEKEFRAKFPNIKVMAIDDLVRHHDCDLLLDQTYGRTADEYLPVVPENTQLCLGTEFALLRDDFRRLRGEPSKIENKKRHMLVTLGGGNQGNPLRIIGKALRELSNKHEFTATVITGDVPDLRLNDYKAIGQNIELISFSNNIAAEMNKADFVIGAGGGTSWERCCLGLPTVVLTIADNQIEIAKILNEKEAGISVATKQDDIAAAVEKLLTDQALLARMSENAASLCDGAGVSRVINRILLGSLSFREAKADDARFIYEARYAGDASRFYRSKEVPTFDAHVSWLSKAFENEDIILSCMSLCGVDVAHVRLDKNSPTSGEIGICLAEDWRGRGLGQAILESANQYFSGLGVFEIHAEVHKDNRASANIFERAGYEYLSTDSEGYMRYSWQSVI